ncbi:MAG: hypothetical protein WKG07_50115 [Hymenobacter sp.]
MLPPAPFRAAFLPLFEITSNPVNYQAARDAVPGGDFLTSRVYWDK